MKSVCGAGLKSLFNRQLGEKPAIGVRKEKNKICRNAGKRVMIPVTQKSVNA